MKHRIKQSTVWWTWARTRRTSEACPADCYPIGGDGCVNIDDLLAVINQWGQTGAADVFPACAGDSLINIDDLLFVINEWGPCDGGSCPGVSESPFTAGGCWENCTEKCESDLECWLECFSGCMEALERMEE